ncbi:site-specific integrase [Veillonella sp. R32]|uniref:tyrosine-type recombinase/integrase n=1 Tax=Veillonella sp. R32 TaxID=2021312 RepID=UPI00138A5B00|nr:site-specific integrase [Veillonella sp. R32]KAF1679103.1 site-specific integrase [Veillonella sp. R32]
MWIEERQTQKGTVYRYYERYTCPITHKNKRVSVTLESVTPRAKKTAYNKLMCKIELAKEKALHAKEAPKITLHEAVDMWIEYIRPTFSERTQLKYDVEIGKIKAMFDNVPLQDLKSIDIEERLIKFHYEEGKSHRYTCSLLRILKNTLQYARRKGYINDILDFLEIKIKAKPKTIEEVEKSNNKFLDREELKTCFEQLATMHKRIGLLCEFQALTGLRIGELLALRECDYNRFTKVITVNGSYNSHTKTRGTPKNLYSYRDVALNERASEIIDFFIKSNRWQYMNIGEPPEEKRYIFINQNGNPYEIVQINKLLKRLDVNGKHISTHIFRHSHISLLSELGIPLKAIMQRVGHHEPRTTLAIYSHVTENMKNTVVEKLDTLAL